ncbi:hypothetical protein BB559_005179 [Furculomyces boomerangus]|uniref:Uncharacterized protein n=2 Tax=Harpellales TaxID=61421 RepID=A0A2T9YA84_9FUNG|nr:hypothetical protein BB559_005179 [Furculomyces boomerangus]PVZ98974.1 hypothetical protein BB558_005020 [Smittium angustum]
MDDRNRSHRYPSRSRSRTRYRSRSKTRNSNQNSRSRSPTKNQKTERNSHRNREYSIKQKRSRSRSTGERKSISSDKRKESSSSKRKDDYHRKEHKKSEKRSKHKNYSDSSDYNSESGTDFSSDSGADTDSDSYKHRKTERRKEKKKSRDILTSGESMESYMKQTSQTVITFFDFSSIYSKQQEFIAWLIETKKIYFENLSQLDTKKWFRSFIEDFNTCAMPHKKFYDFAKWEAKKAKKEDPRAKESQNNLGQVDLFRDQELLRANRKRNVLSTPSYSMSKEQLGELRQVQNERISAEKLKQMGFKPKEGMGVRYEDQYS